MFWSHPAENGSPPALQRHIQSHIQSKMADLQPSSHVREKSGAICKIRAKYIQRVQRALSPCRSENHIQNHIHGKFRGLKSHLITSESHPTVTSGQNSEASHIRVVTSAITSGQNPVTSRSPPYPAHIWVADAGQVAAALRFSAFEIMQILSRSQL